VKESKKEKKLKNLIFFHFVLKLGKVIDECLEKKITKTKIKQHSEKKILFNKENKRMKERVKNKKLNSLPIRKL
jgi:hypothetical protein